MSGRVPLAEKALSEGHARQRYRDTSLSIWQRQQLKLESAPPRTHLSRSQSAWYSQYGNEAILVRDRNKLGVSRDTGQSKFCTIMYASLLANIILGVELLGQAAPHCVTSSRRPGAHCLSQELQDVENEALTPPPAIVRQQGKRWEQRPGGCSQQHMQAELERCSTQSHMHLQAPATRMFISQVCTAGLADVILL
ncbi:hypothetical protein MC885_017872 [Smutsia gigantea]|nr:hypothetical protein MC885_017872 [Smutsia gigantea]